MRDSRQAPNTDHAHRERAFETLARAIVAELFGDLRKSDDHRTPLFTGPELVLCVAVADPYLRQLNILHVHVEGLLASLDCIGRRRWETTTRSRPVLSSHKETSSPRALH